MKKMYSAFLALSIIPYTALIGTETSSPLLKEESVKPIVVQSQLVHFLKEQGVPVEEMNEQQLSFVKLNFVSSLTEGILSRIAVSIRGMANALKSGQGSIQANDRIVACDELAKLQNAFVPILEAFQVEVLKNEQLITQDDKLLSLTERAVWFSDQILNYLTNQLSHNFEKTVSFDFSFLSQAQTVPALTKDSIVKIEKKVKNLETLSVNVGLTSINKITRKIDKIKKKVMFFHHNFPIAKIAFFGAGLGTYYLWKNADEKSILTKMLGVYPVTSTSFDPKTMQATASLIKKPTRLGHLVHLAQNMGSTDPIINLLGGSMLGLIPTFCNSMYNTITPYIAKTWNKARGGVYGELSVEGLFNMNPRHTLNDVVGYNAIKETMYEIVSCLAKPEQFVAASQKRNMRYLFSGVSRAGKTYMAEALCGSVQQLNPACKLFIVDYQTIQYYGIKNIFAMAKLEAPAILFFDEVHLLNLNEDGNKALLQDLLTAIGGQNDFDPSQPVVVIFATTHPGTLATPLRKRFQTISFGLPNAEERAQYIIKELAQNLLDYNHFNIKGLAEKSEDMSFADLSELFSRACIKAWIEQKLFTQEFLDGVFDQVLRKIIPNSYLEITDKHVSRELATYIAGKAVISSLLDTIRPLDTCTINKVEATAKDDQEETLLDPNSQFGAIFRRSSSQTQGIVSSIEAENTIKILLGGRAAQHVVLGTKQYGIHKEDDVEVYKLIQKWLVPSLPFQGSNMKGQMEHAIYEFYKTYFDQTVKLASDNKQAIEMLATVLQNFGTAPGDYVYWLINMLKTKKALSDQEKEMITNQHPMIILQSLMTPSTTEQNQSNMVIAQ